MHAYRIGRFILALFFCATSTLPAVGQQTKPVLTGAEQTERYISLLADRRVGLVANHSSRIGDTHLLDTLLQRRVCIERLFVPEHGFRGTADDGASIRDGHDQRTGVPIISLYGRKKKPLASDLNGIDLVVFDIQDVGTRFFTYISTLYYVLEACAESGVPVMVFDRPNPNGHYIDGPLLEQGMGSFIGIAPVPIVHGCTIGELARLFAGEGLIKAAENLDLMVIPCANYTHQTPYTLPVRPSPNLPDQRSILLYPGVCLFEGTTVSVGRGTLTPFQWVGHPDFPVGDSLFIPCPMEGAAVPLHEGRVCHGYDMRDLPVDSLFGLQRMDLHWLLDFYCEFPDKQNFFRKDGYFNLLAGTPYLREQIELGTSEEDIRASWAPGLDFFRIVRAEYLLYPE